MLRSLLQLTTQHTLAGIDFVFAYQSQKPAPPAKRTRDTVCRNRDNVEPFASSTLGRLTPLKTVDGPHHHHHQNLP
jgi:hypothetical protein